MSTCSSLSLGSLSRPPVPRLGMWVCQRWAGSGSVVEGNRQLEANVECEELACVVSGGPFKPNKHREVRGPGLEALDK